MPKAPWRAKQEEIASVFDGTRHPLRTKGAPDIESSEFVVELRVRKKLPRFLDDAVQRARRSAGDRRAGILVLQELDSSHALVVMDLVDFKSWSI